MEYFSNDLYVYQATDFSLTDLELLTLVGTSIQTLRVGDALYFGTSEPVSGSGYILIREPIVFDGGPQ